MPRLSVHCRLCEIWMPWFRLVIYNVIKDYKYPNLPAGCICHQAFLLKGSFMKHIPQEGETIKVPRGTCKLLSFVPWTKHLHAETLLGLSTGQIARQDRADKRLEIDFGFQRESDEGEHWYQPVTRTPCKGWVDLHKNTQGFCSNTNTQFSKLMLKKL